MHPGKVSGYAVCLITLLAATDWMLAQSQSAPGGQEAAPQRPPAQRHLLYVASPGTHQAISGQGILVFDVGANYRFVKRIPTWDLPASQPQDADEVKGIAASGVTGMLYVSTPRRLGAWDLMTEKLIWEKSEGRFDRMALSPDGKTLYSPAGGASWDVIDAMTGNVIKKLDTPQSPNPHNTIYSLDGARVFMAGNANAISVADAKTHTVVQTIGPFSKGVRPFTVNGSGTLVFVNVLELLGFEVGDVRTGNMIHRVEVAGFGLNPEGQTGHSSPSHGIALSPDEKEIWLADGRNNYLHVFDATVMPPKQVKSIRLRFNPGWYDDGSSRGRREHAVGWVTFGLDGKYVYPSTGDVIDAATKRVIAALTDEFGRPVDSEKIVEVLFSRGKPLRASDQFGVGLVRGPARN